jgi:hypothetical protein
MTATPTVVPFLFGWELAEIAVVEGRLRLRSGTARALVGADEQARCLRHPEHVAPVSTCSCGFFALERSEALVLSARFPFSALLEVELTGPVIRGRGTMRAAHQRALRVLVLPTCAICDAPASALASRSARHGGVARPGEGAGPGEVTLTAVCAPCAAGRRWHLDELTTELDIPVSWAVPAEALVLHGLGSRAGEH